MVGSEVSIVADIYRSLSRMDDEECAKLLAEHHVGRVAYEAEGRLHIIPLNYVTDAAGRVLFCTTSTALLYRAALDRVAFEIDGIDERKRTGWSVCVHGTAWAVADGDVDTATLRALPLRAVGPRPALLVVRDPLASRDGSPAGRAGG